MSVIRSLQSLSAAVTVTRRETAQTALRPFLEVDTGSRTDLLRARSRLRGLFLALEGLAEAASVRVSTRLDIADAKSQSALGLDLERRAAALESSNEINAAPMSFTPFGPDWSTGSTALITIGGEYDGSNGSDTLYFEVRRAGVHGEDDLRIRVEDSQGNRLRNLNIRASHAPDRQYNLRNGLYLTLGDGSLVNRDLASMQVFDNIGAAVDPAKPLGGIRNQNPNLEFGIPAISDGSFLLNGTDVAVSTSDSINDVIDRINASGAGVTAAFNATSERIEFQQNTVGAGPGIDLAGDTSGFLVATKLDSANTVAGRSADTEVAMETVAGFAGIQAGEFMLNGQAITIDPATDSLDDVIERINSSGTGVSAQFDPVSQLVSIDAGESSAELDIDSNGTGFFGAINIEDGRYEAGELGRGLGRRRSYRIADALDGVFSELNTLLRDANFVQGDANVAAFRAPLQSAIRAAFGDAIDDGIGGLSIDDSIDARRRSGYAEMDRQVFTRQLQSHADPLMTLLGGRGDNAGLIERLMIGTGQALRAVNSQLGIEGGVLDLYA